MNASRLNRANLEMIHVDDRNHQFTLRDRRVVPPRWRPV
jgi:hypothetical protein